MRLTRTHTVACIVVLGSAKALGQTPTPIPEASIAPQEFRTVGAEATWRRPPEVTHILLHGCGGGGGGASGTQVPVGDGYADQPGLGGAAAPTTTLILAVKADTYKIKVGAGGAGNNSGVDTTFQGTDYDLALPAGAGGASSSQAGARSPFATGGAGGGPVGGGGSPANGPCAGGGGAYYSGIAGGAGGPGFAVVYPLPDLARFARVLSTIERLSTEQAAQPEQPPSQNPPAGLSAAPPAASSSR